MARSIRRAISRSMSSGHRLCARVAARRARSRPARATAPAAGTPGPSTRASCPWLPPGEVHHPALGEQDDVAAVGQVDPLDRVVEPDPASTRTPCSAGDVDLPREVPAVREHRARCDPVEERCGEHVRMAGRGDEHLAPVGEARAAARPGIRRAPPRRPSARRPRRRPPCRRARGGSEPPRGRTSRIRRPRNGVRGPSDW